MKRLEKTRKEYRKLNLLSIIMIGKIQFPSNLKDWKKFEQNNTTIALSILYVPYNTKQIKPAHISKYNNKRDNQVILLMITDNEKWH